MDKLLKKKDRFKLDIEEDPETSLCSKSNFSKNTIDLLLKNLVEFGNNYQESLNSAIGLVNLNLTKEIILDFLKKKPEEKIIDIIIESPFFDVKKYLIIFFGNLLKKNNITFSLTKNQFDSFYFFIHDNLFNSNLNEEKILFINEIFRLFLFLNLKDQKNQSFLINVKFQKIILEIRKKHFLIIKINPKLSKFFFSTFYDFLDYLTEEVNFFKKNQFTQIFFESLLVDFDKYLLNNIVDITYFQIPINLIINNFQFSEKTKLNETISLLLIKSYEIFNNSSIENKEKIETYNENNEELIKIFKNSEIFYIFLTKLFEDSFFFSCFQQNKEEVILTKIFYQVIENTNMNNRFMTLILENFEKEENKQLINSYLKYINIHFTCILNMTQSFLSFENELDIFLFDFLYSELKNHAILLKECSKKLEIINLNEKIIDKILNSMLSIIENINENKKISLFSKIDFSELINIFHFFYQMGNINSEISLEIFELINLFLQFLNLKKDIDNEKHNIGKLLAYSKDILKNEICLYKKSGIINLIFTIFGEKNFDCFYFDENFPFILKNNLKELEEEINGNIFNTQDEKFIYLTDTYTNLKEFLKYKELF